MKIKPLTEIKIRKAKKQDARKISLLRRDTIRKISSKEYPKNILDYLLKGQSVKGVLNKMKERKIFCAWEGKRLVGTADLEIKRKRIGGFFVKTNLIGKGIGSKLLEFVEEYAKKKGIKKLNLNPSNFAFNFYKKRGYKVVGETTWMIKNCKEKLKIMEKKL